VELTGWIDTLIEEAPRLWECLKTNQFPASFLSRALGLEADVIQRLPTWLSAFVAVYLLCGIVTVILRFAVRQKSLSSAAHLINTAILTCCCTVFVPLLVYLGKAFVYVVQNEVAPLNGDYLRFFGDVIAKSFYMIMAIAGVACTVWMPLSTVIRYLRVHHLRGLPHLVLDVGTGPFLIAVYLLSSQSGRTELYWLLLAALVLLVLVQSGGYLPEEEKTAAAMALHKADTGAAKAGVQDSAHAGTEAKAEADPPSEASEATPQRDPPPEASEATSPPIEAPADPSTQGSA